MKATDNINYLKVYLYLKASDIVLVNIIRWFCSVSEVLI